LAGSGLIWFLWLSAALQALPRVRFTSSFPCDTSQVIVHRYGSDTVHEDAGFGILTMTGAALDVHMPHMCVVRENLLAS
jgi:hypothetical protein